MPTTDLSTVIAALNQLGVGDLEKIVSELRAVRGELRAADVSDELVQKLDECERALLSGNLEAFRKLRETVISRLGHLRGKKKS